MVNQETFGSLVPVHEQSEARVAQRWFHGLAPHHGRNLLTVLALGDSNWNLGRHDEADVAYARALDWSASRAERRALHIARQVLSDSSLEATLREYLTDLLPQEPGLALLAHAMTARPQSPLPRYLMGRRLYFAGRFAEAAQSLADLHAQVELPEDARLASLELLARAHLRRGAAGEARAALAAVEAFRLEAAEELLFDDIEARARWLPTWRGRGRFQRGENPR